jgi:hypothetical protein
VAGRARAGCHRDDRERLVDFVQVDVAGRPAELGVQLLHRADRRGGEPAGFLRMRCVAENDREWRKPSLLGNRAPHQNQCGRAIGNRARVGGGDGSILAKRRLESRDFCRVGLARLLVGLDHDVTLAARYRDRRDLPLERTVLIRAERARQRSQRKFVLSLARKRVFVGALLGEYAHQLAFVVGVFETVRTWSAIVP